MSKVLTENSYLEEKVKLRILATAEITKNELLILDCFSADGTLWNLVKQQTTKKIHVLRIEKRKDAKGVYLVGDNMKYLENIDLYQFDIIDLDAFGFAIDQLDVILQRGYNGIIILTFIHLYNSLSNKILIQSGYTLAMIKKCRSLLCAGPLDKLKMYLSTKRIYEMKGYFIGNKNYFYIRISQNRQVKI